MISLFACFVFYDNQGRNMSQYSLCICIFGQSKWKHLLLCYISSDYQRTTCLNISVPCIIWQSKNQHVLTSLLNARGNAAQDIVYILVYFQYEKYHQKTKRSDGLRDNENDSYNAGKIFTMEILITMKTLCIFRFGWYQAMCWAEKWSNIIRFKSWKHHFTY